MKIITLIIALSSLHLFAEDLECKLGYENKLKTVRVISERVYPVDTYREDIEIIRETYYRYSRELRDLMDRILDENGADLNTVREKMFYFDDFEAFELEGQITYVNYGVGGGNGGITYIKNGEVVADYFDGDLLYCAPSYISTTY